MNDRAKLAEMDARRDDSVPPEYWARDTADADWRALEDEAREGKSMRFDDWLVSPTGASALSEVVEEIDRVYKLAIHDEEKLGLIYGARDIVYTRFAESFYWEGK